MKQVTNNRLVKLGLKTIPKAWDEIKLKKILKTSYLGGNYPNSETNNGVPLIKMGNIGRGTILLDRLEYLPNGFDVAEEHFLKEGDLLFNTRNTLDLVGKVSVWKNELPHAACNSNLLKIFFKENKVYSNYFMNYVFNSYYVLKQLRAIATGTTSVAAIYDRDLKNINILLPSLKEQKKIELILSTWDTAIALIEKLIDAKRRLKKGLMQQLLMGKRRFKGFTSKWNRMAFNQCARFLKGYSYNSEDYSDNPDHTYFITLNCILKGGGFSKDGMKYLKNDPPGDFLVKKGDLVFANTDITRDGDVVGCPLSIPKFSNGRNVAISMDLTKVVCSDNVKTKFMYYYLQTPKVRKFMKSRSAGSTVLHLDVKAVKKMGIEIPSDINEQEKIAGVLSLIDSEIDLLEKRIKEFMGQKQGLMQKLLTGKIRVKP